MLGTFEMKFPSFMGVSLDGHLLIIDSKNKLRKLKKFNAKTGHIQYYPGEYDGTIIRQLQCSIPANKVDTFEQWKEKQKEKCL
jgi:hypothetical protein